MKYGIGDNVWVADFQSMAPTYVECPDCGGTGRLRVIFHDEEMVSIECTNCSSGYNDPSGRIVVYQNSVSAKWTEIIGIEIGYGGKVEYKTRDHYILSEDDMFDNQEDAIAYGEQKQEAYRQEQIDGIAKKEKDTRTWAWNASYHRNNIKRAQKDIVYHTSKLNVASLKAKEDKKP